MKIWVAAEASRSYSVLGTARNSWAFLNKDVAE